MGTSRLNIWFRGANCDLLTNVWRTDLVIQACTGTYLVNIYPLVDQLRKRYSTQGKVVDISDWPLTTDQADKKLELIIGGGATQSVTFTTPAQTLEEIFGQLDGKFTGCKILAEDRHLKVVTDAYGPSATIEIGSGTDCDIAWDLVKNGSGWTVDSHYYQGAQRIKIVPPSGEYVNHVDVDVPPGCYKIWTRVCHGNNEETSLQMVNPKCGDEVCVNLLLPTLRTCSAGVLHPLMDEIVYKQALADDEQRIAVFRGVMFGAQVAKQEVINQLDYRLLEAQEKQDSELEARVNAVIALANQLPECV